MMMQAQSFSSVTKRIACHAIKRSSYRNVPSILEDGIVRRRGISAWESSLRCGSCWASALDVVPDHVTIRPPIQVLPFVSRNFSTTASDSKGIGGFRPRRMTNYMNDRITSRAKKPKGPRNPKSFLIDRHPVSLGGDDDLDDDNDDFDDYDDYEEMDSTLADDGVDLLDPNENDGIYERQTKTILSQPQWMDKSIGPFYNLHLGDELSEHSVGIQAAREIRKMIQERETIYNPNYNPIDPNTGQPFSQVESAMRDIDYLTAAEGSTEDLVGRRQALRSMESVEERETFMQTLEQSFDRAKLDSLDLQMAFDEKEAADIAREEAVKRGEVPERDPDQQMSQSDREAELVKDYDIKPHHDWSETVVRVDRVQKVQRGGTMVRYRCLVVGGNTKGVIGFAVGKAQGPQEAAMLASRLCKRNIYFVERYMGSGLMHDLRGKHNSCKVTLRARPKGTGFKGNPLCEEILVCAGITDCTAKAHGNRNPYNVVRATFKALLTQDSIEDVAMARGKRLVELERAKRMQLM